MSKFTISSSMRFFFMIAGSVLWLGIGLTGFSVVHWLLFVPAAFLVFAAITGICPGMIISNLLFPPKKI